MPDPRPPAVTLSAPASAAVLPNTRSRSQRREQTRAWLLQAALDLIGQGRSFASLGLREIARGAGMVPNAFYRHFSSTEALGLALVQQVGVTLRRLLREVRQAGLARDLMLRRSVQVYFQYVRENRQQFLFISSERSGGSKTLRQAVRNDMAHFASEMAQDFRSLGLYNELPAATLQMVCGLIVNSMLAAAPEILDLPAGQPLLEQEAADCFVQQLQIVLLGAASWQTKSPAGAQGAPGQSGNADQAASTSAISSISTHAPSGI